VEIFIADKYVQFIACNSNGNFGVAFLVVVEGRDVSDLK
jgi:hypothetical protein